MATFRCRLGTLDGKVIKQYFNALDEEALKKVLEEKKYYIFEIKKKISLLDWIAHSRRKIAIDDFVVFNQEFIALIKSGLTILQSLDILIRRRKKSYLRDMLEAVRSKIYSGASLSEAFRLQGDIIPKIYISSLISGERSGNLVGVLNHYIRYIQTLAAVRKKVISAIIYPIILITLSIGLVTLLLSYVIPRFSDFYADFNAQLPILTQALLSISLFIKNNFILLIAILTLELIGLSLWKKTINGRLFIDRLKLKLPFMGQVAHKYALTQFIRSLATMLEGGIPLVPSFMVASESIGNYYFSHHLSGVLDRIKEGQSLHESLEETKLIPHMALEMVQVGESTGSLVEMLNNVADFYDQDIDHRITRLLSIMEPVLLIVMALIVASMLLSMYLPLFTIVSRIG
jgi:type IV pilus assembly protein PilC